MSGFVWRKIRLEKSAFRLFIIGIVSVCFNGSIVRIGGCHSGIEKIACRLQSVIPEIGVYIHCGGDLRVAEDLLNRLYGDTALKGDGCEAVPELMGSAGYSCFLPVSSKSCAELFFVMRCLPSGDTI